ncbi:hypothetical protein NC99_35150 [Sunxiuqinia dokdonensis]|uniref:Uncharacterized protein n=1 Tax=Sunxiuqinia dokdonensis TaxID=1409788 RepID=A0A0L8V535_9BACT|nr:hypothetical protein NC99_35150 [Sunxiuqinia dokdonensis]
MSKSPHPKYLLSSSSFFETEFLFSSTMNKTLKKGGHYAKQRL